MCNFAVDLATSILNLEIQKNRILEKDQKLKRLCHCRREILKSYIRSCEMLFVRTTARIVKYLDDKDPRYSTIHDPEELREWFRSATYNTMYENPCVSNKMVVLFKLIQEVLDNHFFDFFAGKYEQMIIQIQPEHVTSKSDIPVVKDFLNEMAEWLDTSIFNILAIRLDCRNIDDRIYEDYNVPPDTQCCTLNTDLGNCSECVFQPNKDEDCEKQHDIMEQYGEDIHLYVVDEMLDTKGWLENFLKTVNKYHTRINDVYLVVDFSLLESNRKMNKDNMRAIKTATDIFRSVSFTGTNRITNFSEVQ